MGAASAPRQPFRFEGAGEASVFPMPDLDPTLSQGMEVEDEDYALGKVFTAIVLLLLVFVSGFALGAVLCP